MMGILMRAEFAFKRIIPISEGHSPHNRANIVVEGVSFSAYLAKTIAVNWIAMEIQ